MGACASLPKAMRSEAAAPEPAKEDTTSSTVDAPKLATVEVEEVEEKVLEVEAPKEVAEVEIAKPEQAVEAHVSSEPAAASNEEKKKTEVVEQN